MRFRVIYRFRARESICLRIVLAATYIISRVLQATVQCWRQRTVLHILYIDGNTNTAYRILPASTEALSEIQAKIIYICPSYPERP